MYPSQHILIGFFFSLILLFLFPQIALTGFLIVWIASFMIDIDHYLYFVYRKKSLNPKKAYGWFITQSRKFHSLSREERNKIYSGFFVLHGIEIIFLLVLLYFINPHFGFVALGFTIHLALDVLYELNLFDRIDRVSLVYDFIKTRKLKFIEDIK